MRLFLSYGRMESKTFNERRAIHYVSNLGFSNTNSLTIYSNHDLILQKFLLRRPPTKRTLYCDRCFGEFTLLNPVLISEVIFCLNLRGRSSFPLQDLVELLPSTNLELAIQIYQFLFHFPRGIAY